MTALKNFTELACALSKRTLNNTEALYNNDIIGAAGSVKSIVFVLVDGMGECYLDRLPADSFLKKNKIKTLTSVFPSTTASAMISLATGLSTARHGISGRYSYSPERELHFDTLSLRERFSGRDLSQEINTARIWPGESFIANSEVPVFSTIPKIICNSPFQQYLCGNNSVDGYNTIEDAVDSIIFQVKRQSERSFHFLYLWELDSLGHQEGMRASGINKLLKKINIELERLYDEIKLHADIVISADHGHIDAGEAFIITPEHELMNYLQTPPFGEPRVSQLKVIKAREFEFKSYFNENFGNNFTLYPIADSANQFGADSFSALALKNFSNYIAIAKNDNLLIYTEGAPEDTVINKAEHGGNSPEERLIPLIIP